MASATEMNSIRLSFPVPRFRCRVREAILKIAKAASRDPAIFGMGLTVTVALCIDAPMEQKWLWGT